MKQNNRCTDFEHTTSCRLRLDNNHLNKYNPTVWDIFREKMKTLCFPSKIYSTLFRWLEQNSKTTLWNYLTTRVIFHCPALEIPRFYDRQGVTEKMSILVMTLNFWNTVPRGTWLPLLLSSLTSREILCFILQAVSDPFFLSYIFNTFLFFCMCISALSLNRFCLF